MKLAGFFWQGKQIIQYLCPAKELHSNTLIQCSCTLKIHTYQSCQLLNIFPELHKTRVTSVCEIPCFGFTLIS